MKTVCIYHSIDLDGWMSAAIVKHWFNSKYGNNKNKTCSKSECIQEDDFECKSCCCNNYGIDEINFIGYNYGQPIPDLSEYDKVIMCDISFPKKEMYELHFKLQNNFIWIDHHISAIKENNETITGDDFEGLYSYLCTEAKQVYKNGFPISFKNVDKKKGELNYFYFICINKERFNPITFDIDYHSDGYDGACCFHYDGVAKVWRFSLYNDNGLVDCSVIAKQYGGGGHKGASGFTVNNLEEFLKGK